MKFYFILFFLLSITLNQGWAESIKEIKIDNAFTIKFDEKEWEYMSYENINKYQPHLFVNKRFKLKLVFESVRLEESFESFNDLINSTCSKANELYHESNSGFAQMESINGVPTCYAEYKSMSGNLIHNFIFPETQQKKKNKLYKFVWTSTSKKSKKVVSDFIQAFIK